MRVIIVHGFNITDGGKNTIDRLIPYLKARGYEVIEYDYGWRGLLGVRFMSNRDAEGLCAICNPGDTVIGHSNGGHIIARAIEMGAPIIHAIMIHPALDIDWSPPWDHSIQRVDVYYSKLDKATWLAQFSPWMWGGMGTYGPSSDDIRMISHEEIQTHSQGFIDHPGKYLETLNG